MAAKCNKIKKYHSEHKSSHRFEISALELPIYTLAHLESL
jgi:hypothetical protein